MKDSRLTIQRPEDCPEWALIDLRCTVEQLKERTVWL